MIFTQYYLDCLSQASYLIADEESKQAVVVDPRRDIREYVDDARERGLTIVGVINTHFHADFVSGHLELAEETGAWIGYGEAAVADFEVRHLADGERISLGDVTLEIMATPGHTPESISVLVYEHADDEVAYGVLTGDALFIGDVGRPDLLASIGVTAEQLGKMLYDTIQNKLMGLDDAVRVFPAHGAGSACGKNLSTEKQSTIGEQRKFNYACQPMTEEEFLAVVTAGQPSAPEYFVYNAILNRQERGVREIDTLAPALSIEEVEAALADGALVHDARDPQDFAAAHLAGAVNVPVDGRMAETVGMVFKPEDKIVIVAPAGEEQEVATRFARIGYDHVVGYVAEPENYFLTHQDDVRHASRLTVAELDEAVKQGDVQLLDIRNAGELEAGTIPGSVHIPLAELSRRIDEVDATRPVVAYCAGGWRSSVGASLLRARGYLDVSDIHGGYAAWEQNHALSA
jgi:hydroxyacylglutathione hydrolase